ncbi:hypothetical protein RB597_000623 [Gaeumannomyces tritici]
MSGWLKSGMGTSPSEEPISPGAALVPSPSGNRPTGSIPIKGWKDPESPRTAKSRFQNSVTNQNEADTPEKGACRGIFAYREQLRKQMSSISGRESPPAGVPKRPSPIEEETSPRAPEPVPTTTSTESTATIRGMPTPSVAARTPSYPFPRMASMGAVPSRLHRPFTKLSPTVTPDVPHGGGTPNEANTLLDRLLSNPSTPASTMTFHPAEVAGSPEELNEFPTPNLYELSLLLSAEPGLDAWWQTVVQIMADVYQAERVTLAVPADTTDIENVPWGQKATYNSRGEDDLSLGYLARGSSLVRTNSDIRSETTTQLPATHGVLSPIRPNFASRHSFTAFEMRKEPKVAKDAATLAPERPTPLQRSKSSYPVASVESDREAIEEDHPPLNQQTLEEHDAAEHDANFLGWDASVARHHESQARVLPMLQALDYEADPLIDHNGIRRVLERGKVIALTRSYPYLGALASIQPEEPPKENMRCRSPEGPRKQQQTKRPRPESISKLSSLLSGAALYKGGKKPSQGDRRRLRSGAFHLDDDDGAPRPPTPKYEEYEQPPPSPWSQSPAPSPAIRADPSENPFFTDAVVDESSFNPTSPPNADYASMKPPETIGVENSWTVLHIPLSHVILSKPTATFKLDTTLMERKSHSRNRGHGTGADLPTPVAAPSPGSTHREKHSPIAVLSILTPLIPYPTNLRHSLSHLAPHLATSFSLCRHYTNLETELAGLQKRRPEIARFAGLGTDGRMISEPFTIGSMGYTPGEMAESQRSAGGSITSPSDYSVPSRSATGSAAGTPSWDVGGLGLVTEKRQVPASPLAAMGDSYFSVNPSQSSSRLPPGTPGVSAQRDRRNSKDSSVGEKKPIRRQSSVKIPKSRDPGAEHQSSKEHEEAVDLAAKGLLEDSQLAAADRGGDAAPLEINRKGLRPGHRHTQLHSYGADFSHTFQSLPPSSTVGRGQHPPSRSGSGPVPREMLPPSDTLKGLILDSLPAHVFVAQPPLGEMLWVNSRYLSYRGVTAPELAADPHLSLHPDDREEYIRSWVHSLRTGDPFSRTVRIRRFDGAYRWFQARAIATRDKRNVVQQFLGSYMDIHDQHIAELRAAKQKEIEASEAKHKLLANLIPQIIFTATEDEGITFANDQWLSYTGQSQEASHGLGFISFVHPEDLANCRIPPDGFSTPIDTKETGDLLHSPWPSALSPTASRAPGTRVVTPGPSAGPEKHSIRGTASRRASSGSSSSEGQAPGDLTKLARKGVIKASLDSNGRLSYTTEVRLRSKKGEYRWHLIRVVEVIDSNPEGNISSYLGSATDINDHKLIEAKLKDAMETKTRFLSNMSHEIRTPLIGISGMVSFLQETTLNEEQRDYTNTIHTSANSLIMIINDILDLSKVDAGMMKLKFEWFHTQSLIEAVNELVSTMAIAKGLELNYIVEPDVPAWVKGDKVRIRQVLLNVIGNAIKFTSDGEVFSRCRVANSKKHSLEDEIELEFSVVDTGRGFTKEEAELIFKPFSQIDGSSTRQHGGSGLGLVISRQLVELHGGKMGGTAVPGKGSTFTFTAKFGLPTEDDQPDSMKASQDIISSATIPEGLQAARLFKTPPSKPSPVSMLPSTGSTTTSPGDLGKETCTTSPAATTSSASSDPSVRSSMSHTTQRTSMSSINAGLVNFSEAARASGQDLSQMKLEMPSEQSSPNTSSDTTIVPFEPRQHSQADAFRPLLYSILIISPQTHSREATTKHIEMTLPKGVPHQITSLATAAEAQKLISGEDPVIFTHIVVNLPSTNELIDLMDEIVKSKLHRRARILILSDSVQRQAILKQVAGTEHEDVFSDKKVTYIYKPVKPSRFAVIFDPSLERDLSIDRNRSTAEKIVETQRQSYLEIGERMGNKGHKVLLVEDNPINQKVLIKYLKKVGVDVEVALDGQECTDKVFGNERGYYSLILCDLHMPKKDGYTACKEVREWENEQPDHAKLPIIALSANVMSDVQERCYQAGFDAYVTKPVDFVDLSNTLAVFF